MTKSEFEEVTRKTIEAGGILAKVYFDMHSEKEDDLQPLMTDLISNRLLKFPGVVYCAGEIDTPLKVDDLYATNAVVTLLVKDLWTLINIAFTFVPAGIEVLKPEKEYYLKHNDLQAIMINMAQISAQFSEYVLSKVLSKEDYEKVKKDISRREELGKKIIEDNKKE
jgi:hypothetical protein